jgi:hypothetical protein
VNHRGSPVHPATQLPSLFATPPLLDIIEVAAAVHSVTVRLDNDGDQLMWPWKMIDTPSGWYTYG